MKISLVIPTYWGRKKKIGYKEEDDVYDHPTSLDEEGTLKRVIESTNILKQKDFELVILGVSTCKEIKDKVEEKIKSIIKECKTDIKIKLFSCSQLEALHAFLKSKGKDSLVSPLTLRGYSNVRNMCLVVSHLLESDVTILIDDDEVFEDPLFIDKAIEFIGKELDGKKIYGIAGYYVNPDGDYLIRKEILPWMTFWNKTEWMNQAFKKFIGKGPRLKLAPFVFGGNMVIRKELFTKIPFDPNVPRGEDIDYLLNAKMFGYDFYLDNQLSIKHDPPPKTHPQWRQLREDIYRFVFTRSKIESQAPNPNMRIVKAEELDPYPGRFLKDNLNELVFKSNTMLATDYLIQSDPKGYRECMRNIYLADYDAPPKFDPFLSLLELQKKWAELMEYLGGDEVSSYIAEKLSLQSKAS